jgi:hypothetical protein
MPLSFDRILMVRNSVLVCRNLQFAYNLVVLNGEGVFN